MRKCRKCKVEMKYQWSDADDIGGIEEWMECPECSKTADIPKAKAEGHQPTESAQAQAGGRIGGSHE